MNCPKCGKPIEEGKGFCPYCGTNLNESAPVNPYPAPQAQDPYRNAVQKPPKKGGFKWWYILLGVLGLIVLIFWISVFKSCAASSLNEMQNDARPVLEESASSSEASSEVSAAVSDETEAPTATPEPTPEPEPEVKTLSVEESVVYDKDDVKVTVTGISADGFMGPELNLLVENNSEKNIIVKADYCVVNNYMVYPAMSISAASGKKANDSMTIMRSDLELADIDEIGELDFSLVIIDEETFHRIDESDEIAVKTSLYDDMEIEAQDEGKEVYNADGIRIVAKYLREDTFWGAGMVLYIENNSDSDIIVQQDDFSVNGFMVSAMMSETVKAGRMDMAEIAIFDSDLEENNIEKIEDMELVFSIIDPETFYTIYTSDVVEIKVE